MNKARLKTTGVGKWSFGVRNEKGRHIPHIGPDDSSNVDSDSDVAQYAWSSRAGSFGSDRDRFRFSDNEGEHCKPAQFSPVRSEGKPPPLSDNGADTLKPVVTEDASGAKTCQRS
jgi:hypothetical protein